MSWRLDKILTYGLIGAVSAACLYLGYQFYDPRALKPLPEEHDPIIAGEWFTERYGAARKYVFQADGNGEMWARGPVPRKFQWGTRGNQLFLKYRGNGGWETPDFTFRLQNSGTELRLKVGSDSGYFPTQFTRKAPPSASIP